MATSLTPIDLSGCACCGLIPCCPGFNNATITGTVHSEVTGSPGTPCACGSSPFPSVAPADGTTYTLTRASPGVLAPVEYVGTYLACDGVTTIKITMYCSHVSEGNDKICIQIYDVTNDAVVVSQACTSLNDFDCDPFFASIDISDPFLSCTLVYEFAE